MLEFDLLTILLTTAASFVVAVFALWISLRTIGGKGKSTYDLMIESDAETAFLFDNDVLVDATQSARDLLGKKPDNTTDWQWFISAFNPQYSTLADDLGALGDAGALTIMPDSEDDTSRINAEWWNGLARLVLSNTEGASEPLIDGLGLAALETELDILRHTAKLAPYLVWQETRSGQIDWANAAYLALAKSIRPDNHNNSWPPIRLFNHTAVAHHGTDPQTVRVSIENKSINEMRWFDLSCKQVNESTLCFATPADATVRAEVSLKGFVQTLTKTFAHLSIGLTVFDKDRELALFNPALTDLTKLPFDFLSARPTFYTFLDRLRENQMMPEPKDYKNWRHQITALEEAAADGTYEETWALPSGQTYRVIGRPHADGAVALLFEDISAEISLTRNFREELEISQSVLDVLQDAVVVFSSSGMITISNAAYAKLWGVDPSTAFGEMSIVDATRLWNDTCDPTPLWDELRGFVGAQNARQEWFGSATLDTGQRLDCQFSPLTGGATMVTFRIETLLQTSKTPRKKPVGA
ncbi:PAS-domain containing protein [Profundibacter sp.]